MTQRRSLRKGALGRSIGNNRKSGLFCRLAIATIIVNQHQNQIRLVWQKVSGTFVTGPHTNRAVWKRARHTLSAQLGKWQRAPGPHLRDLMDPLRAGARRASEDKALEYAWAEE
jgi:hypothetical protein